jgi:hypothetical protein
MLFFYYTPVQTGKAGFAPKSQKELFWAAGGEQREQFARKSC